jgi:UDP-glucose 4-epimerase
MGIPGHAHTEGADAMRWESVSPLPRFADVQLPTPRAGSGQAAVVGGSGFIGSHLVRALRRAGIPVTSFTTARPAWFGPEPAPEVLHASTIFFLAGTVTPVTAGVYPSHVEAELRMFEQFLAAVRRAPTPSRIVLSSSGGTVYASDGQPPYSEDDAVGPTNSYGAMKLDMERALLAQPSVEPVVLRLANVYGQGQRPRRGQGVIAHWLHAAAQGWPLVLHGDPASTRDYVYIDDTVDLLVRVHRSQRPPPAVINVGSGSPTTLARLAQLIIEVTGSSDRLLTPCQGRPVDRSHVWLDVHRAGESLGWAPRTALPEGLRQTWISPQVKISTPVYRRRRPPLEGGR